MELAMIIGFLGVASFVAFVIWLIKVRKDLRK